LADLFERVELLSEGSLAEADVTGWDWSVQEWELMFDAECRADLCGASDYTRKLFMNRERVVCNSVYALPDGTLLELLHPGVQPSGRYNTSSTNSRLRVIVAWLAGAEWAIAMGDDCLEDPVPDAEEKYLKLGHPLKFYAIKGIDDGFSFCSQVFHRKVVYPEDGTKTLYNLIEQKEITDELLFQFSMELRNSPRLAEFLESAARVRVAGRVGQNNQ
jgi:hypothetical protein